MDKKVGRTVVNLFLTMAILFLPTIAFAGDSFSAASAIVLEESYLGTLETEEDVIYYKFTTTNNDSFYKVELRNTEVTGAICIKLYLEDDSTTDFYELDVSKSTANSYTRKLKPNHTYYISIQGSDYVSSIGNYKVSVTEIKDDVPDSYAKSTSLSLNKKKAHNLEVVGDTDYFKFTTTNNDSFYKIELANSEATNNVSTTLYYEDDITTEVLEIEANKSRVESQIIKLEPNHTYYAIVQAGLYSSSTGTYKLCATEIKDDASDTFKSSKKIELNKKSTYKLNVDVDVDYFKFKTSKGGTYSITLANKSGNDSIDAKIYSDADVTQNIGTITSYKAAKNLVKMKLKKNHTYYIVVEKSREYNFVTGEYSLTIKK